MPDCNPHVDFQGFPRYQSPYYISYIDREKILLGFHTSNKITENGCKSLLCLE